MMKEFMKNIILDNSDPKHKIAHDYKKIIGANQNEKYGIKEIQDLIIKDKIYHALDKISVLLPEKEKQTIIIMKREYKSIEANYVKGILTFEESRTAKNNIVNRLLILIKQNASNSSGENQD